MKGLYIAYINLENPGNSGYIEKITGQVETFLTFSDEVAIISLDLQEYKILINRRKKSEIKKPFALYKQYKLSLTARFLQYWDLFRFITQEKPDYIYIRYYKSDVPFLFFLFLIKHKFPKIIEIIEIPTYPYDKEKEGLIKGLIPHLDILTDKLCRNFLKYVIDKIAVVNYKEPVFGASSISFQNGIDIHNIPCYKKSGFIENTISLISVSYINYWHGLDRVIRGLSDYYRQKDNLAPDFILHIIGEGIELPKIKELAINLDIQNRILFHGLIPRRDLDDYFSTSDIAIGNLGIHRIGLCVATPLKNREYCARGMPFIYGFFDPDFSGKMEFALEIPANDDPVDFQAIIDLHRRVITDTDSHLKIRKYAEEHLSWEMKMKPICDYIEKRVSRIT
jgi:glycosyltransferase involved in cell wall biosynthesis